jgi:hypothetical protein
MTDDSAAEPGRPVLAARAHRRRPVDELGFADRLHFSQAVGTVHRAALDKNRLGDFMAAADVGEQLIEEKPVPRVVPQVMVGSTISNAGSMISSCRSASQAGSG